MALLDTIPGVDKRTAELLIAEIGADMSVFPTHRHLASWAGICPGQNESAGKKRSGKTRKGSKWLRSGLTEAAKAASRSEGPTSPPNTNDSVAAAAAESNHRDRPLDPRRRLWHILSP